MSLEACRFDSQLDFRLGPNYAYTGARIDRETVKCETHNAIS